MPGDKHNIHFGVDELVHEVVDPVFNYFVFLLHMLLTCYLTLLLYLAAQPKIDGDVCLVCFFVDWNILALLTFPLMQYTKRLLFNPFGFFLLMLVVVLLITVFGHDLAIIVENALDSVFGHYEPIFFRLL